MDVPLGQDATLGQGSTLLDVVFAKGKIQSNTAFITGQG